MSAAESAAESAKRPIKALFLDFDSTLSVPIFLQRANKWAVRTQRTRTAHPVDPSREDLASFKSAICVPTLFAIAFGS